VGEYVAAFFLKTSIIHLIEVFCFIKLLHQKKGANLLAPFFIVKTIEGSIFIQGCVSDSSGILFFFS